MNVSISTIKNHCVSAFKVWIPIVRLECRYRVSFQLSVIYCLPPVPLTVIAAFGGLALPRLSLYCTILHGLYISDYIVRFV